MQRRAAVGSRTPA